MDSSEHRRDPVDEIEQAIAVVRDRNPVEYDPIEYERAARLLADVAERLRWMRRHDLNAWKHDPNGPVT